MNRRFILILISVIMILASFICPAIAKNLVFSEHNAPTGLNHILSQYWFDEVEKQTEGRIKIEDFWAGALFSSPEALKAVQDGAVDMASVFPNYYPDQLVLHNIFKLFPIGPTKWNNILWVYNTIYETIPDFTAELEKYNQKVIFKNLLLPGSLCSNYPVKSIDDLAGKRWRATSKWDLALLRSVGAIPVSIPWADAYMALQTRGIDGVWSDFGGIFNQKHYEVGENIFRSEGSWYGTPWLRTINLDVWNSLSEEDQAGIMRASEIVEKEIVNVEFDKNIENIISTVEAAGCTITYWSEEDEAKWANEDVVAGLQEEWIKEAEELGVENAREIMGKVKEIVAAGIQREK